MADKYYWQCYLQQPTVEQVQEYILRQGEILHDTYVRDSKLLPQDALYEIRFEELDNDLVGTMEKLYAHFGWDNFDADMTPVLEEYAESLANFKKNSFSTLSDDAKKLVQTRWKNWFTDLNYDM